MDAPSNFTDGMTIEEAAAGYILDGESVETARAMARALLGPSIAGLPVI